MCGDGNEVPLPSSTCTSSESEIEMKASGEQIGRTRRCRSGSGRIIRSLSTSRWALFFIALGLLSFFAREQVSAQAELAPISYRDSELVVDLGVGLWAWPLPVDFDEDGDLDLVVACPDVPFRGLWFFENPDGNVRFPVFRRPVRVSGASSNVCVSWPKGEAVVTTPGHVHPRFRSHGLEDGERIAGASEIAWPAGRIRADEWHLIDWEEDGDLDLIVGRGDWSEYGWDDAWDGDGNWTNGPLHGRVYLVENRGRDEEPAWEAPRAIEVGASPIDVYGMPSPNLADFDGDGDLDLVCGEFLDRFMYFENTGTRREPRFAPGRFLEHGAATLRMHLEMIVPVAVDWDRDGDVDLVVGQEDGRVALVENTGRRDARGVPEFLPPRFFEAEAGDVKFGALVTPDAADWDGDGDLDVICGNTAGEIAWLENLDGPSTGRSPPRLAPPRLLEAGGETIRIQAGPKGSIQGPCEAKWGYTTLSVADWDQDGRLDLVVNSILGNVVWYRNSGTKTRPRLDPAAPIEVEWEGPPPKPEWTWWTPEGNALITQWRTRPVVIDWTRDGLVDLVIVDHEGYLALFERRRDASGALRLLPGRRVFIGPDGEPIRWGRGRAGKSGRRKFAVVDWDGDGKLDLIVDSKSADWWRQVEERDGRFIFESKGPVSSRVLAGHTTSPTVVDWDANGIPDVLLGAEDGRLWYLENPRAEATRRDDRE